MTSTAPTLAEWAAAATSTIFDITFDRTEAEQSRWSRVYLKELATELAEENGGQVPRPLPEIADRILIARLSLDPEGDAMSDDDDRLTVLSNLPKGQTSFDYLVGAWKRCRSQQVIMRKTLSGDILAQAQSALDDMRGLVVSYLGLIITTPDMFANASKPSTSQLRQKTISSLSLVPSFLRHGAGSLTSTSDPYSSSQPTTTDVLSGDANRWASFAAHELPDILSELAGRFNDEGLDEILGPALSDVARQILQGPDDGTTTSASQHAAPAANGSGRPAINSSNDALNAAAAAGDVRAVLAHLLGQAPAGGGGPGPAAGAPPLGLAASTSDGIHIGSMDWTAYANVFCDASNNKQIATMMTKLPVFNPSNLSAPAFERQSLLGPVLRLSSFADSSPAICRDFFADPTNRATMHASQMTLRSTLATVHTLHFRLFNNLIRAGGAETREAVLAYWGSACELNKKRGAMRVRAREVASDSFMVNLFESVMRFCEPFMDLKYSKIDRIDIEYLRTQKRFHMDDLTRLNASESEADTWTKEAPTPSAAPNFITECYFIALRLLNLGPGKAIRSLNDKSDELRRLKKRIKEVEQDRASWSATPQAMQYETFLKRGQAEVARIESDLISSETQLLDDDFVNRLVILICFVMTWLVRVADVNGNHPAQTVKLPLNKEVPITFRMLPEHIFEDVCEILLFLGRYKPNCLTEPAKNDLVTFCTTFLSSGWFIKNPFLRAKLAEILFYNVLPFGQAVSGVVGDVINFHPLALEHLVPALMSFWIEAESTGSHTQFYDKFNIRYHLSRIFKTVWNNAKHKERLNAVAISEDGQFPIFVNRLLNDVTFLLDDALEKLLELRNKQHEVESEAFAQRTPEERAEVEGHLRGLEGQIRSMLDFGNEFLDRLIDFTGEEGRTKDAFMQSEIVGRLASMLDFNLDLLVGEKCQELKVKDPKKVGFHPRELLKKILRVYMNLAPRTEFIKAIAADGRSYRQATFDKATRIAFKYMLYGGPELETIKTMVKEVEQARQDEAEEDDELGEIPDEFLDPLMATLMTDPVILPSSKAVLDRSTIKSHLLSDSSDPFNRAPLKIEEVVPDTELKAKIEAFRLEKKQARSLQ